MDTLLPHQVRYDVNGHISVAVVAESLVANGKLAMEAAFLLEALIPGLGVERAEVSVRRVTHESPLQQAFVIALVTVFQKNMERDVPEIVTDLTGLVVPDRYLSCTRFRRHRVWCFMEQEVRHGKKTVYAGVQA